MPVESSSYRNRRRRPRCCPTAYPVSTPSCRSTATAPATSDYTSGELALRRLTLDPVPTHPAIAHDVDQDAITDLVGVDAEGHLRLYRGLTPSEGSPLGFAPGTNLADGLDPDSGLLAVDLDHDGDLDLLAFSRRAEDRFLRNDGDGTFSERADEIGLGAGTSAVAIADFDDDADLDLALARPEGGLRLLSNPIVGPFDDITAEIGLEDLALQALGVLALDADNDGRFDLVAWDAEQSHLLLNRGGAFTAVDLPEIGPWRLARAADFDNDGDQDLMVVDTSGALTLVRNRRDSWQAEPTGLIEPAVTTVEVGDFDDDGDLDLHARLDDGRLRFWRNEGGNRNQWLRLGLRGKNDNNSKNNTEGLYCRIEARTGDAYQAVLGNGGVNHLGLGSRRQADLLRVLWTNGIAQIWQQVSARRTLVEEQVLKGSCPFLYTWTGTEFRFHTDLMWRSPLGMRLADGTRGSHRSARDWVMVPGEALRAEAGELWIQITEELWEAIYIDQQALLVVDHPSAERLIVDEAFGTGTAPSAAPIHWIDASRPPSAAFDHLGRNVRQRLLAIDGRYVDDLPLDRYQGLTHGHALNLTFTDLPAGERKRLVLHGWIFPTDSTINAALAQDRSRDPYPPRLEIRRPDGSWKTLRESIGMPSGKSKAVVAELPRELAGDIELRLVSNPADLLGPGRAGDRRSGADGGDHSTRGPPGRSPLPRLLAPLPRDTERAAPVRLRRGGSRFAISEPYRAATRATATSPSCSVAPRATRSCWPQGTS